MERPASGACGDAWRRRLREVHRHRAGRDGSESELLAAAWLVVREVDVEPAAAVRDDVLPDYWPAVPVVAADSDQGAWWEPYNVLEI